MDDKKEKLVYLLYTAEELADKRCDSYPNCDSCPADNKRIDCMDWLKADCLLSLGVTVQDGKDNDVPTGWIPVTERLPEAGEVVLACGKRHATSGMFQGVLRNKPNMWHWKGNTLKEVTHWMPLPVPPKGK